MSYPYLEDDRVVPHMLETESDYDFCDAFTYTPVSVEEDNETFEGEEEPIKEDEKHDGSLMGNQQTSHLIQIHLPMITLLSILKLRRKTLRRWSHP